MASTSEKAAGEAVSTRGMKNQVRIRGPKPDVSFHAKALDEMEHLLRKHIDQCTDKAVPETVYAQFLFDDKVTFDIKDTSDGIREHFTCMQDAKYNTAPGEDPIPVPLPVTEAVAQVSDTKLKLRRQRAVGKAIIRSISSVDDYVYFEKEAWDTKHADGYRFKYLCNKSYQNKDIGKQKIGRKSTDPASFTPVNGNGNGNGTPTASTMGTPIAQPPLETASGDQSPIKGAPAGAGAEVSEWFKKHGLTPPAAESPARTPTYDCKGSIFVKFSSSQGVVDVVYQHLPVHNHTNERAPDPIPEKSSASRASLPAAASAGTPHDDSGDPMDTSEMASYHATPQAANTPISHPTVPEPALVAQATASTNNAKSKASTNTADAPSKKRKRPSTKSAPLIEDDLSDLEMLDDEWEQENQAPPLPLLDAGWEPDPGDKDLWGPSVTYLVPGVKAAVKTGAKKGGAAAGAKASAAAAAAMAMDMDESSASGSDFEGGGAASKAKGKKKAPAKPKAKASATTSGAEKNGTSGASGGPNSNNHPSKATDTAAGTDKDVQVSDSRPVTRKRTKTGCLTCRGRKLKCDEERGTGVCGQCRRSRPPRECRWPEDMEDDLSDSLLT